MVHRDVAHLSTCDDGCMALAELLGWKVNTGTFTSRSDISFKSVTFSLLKLCMRCHPFWFQAELEEMVKREHALIDTKDAKNKDKEANQSAGAEPGKTDKTE